MKRDNKARIKLNKLDDEFKKKRNSFINNNFEKLFRDILPLYNKEFNANTKEIVHWKYRTEGNFTHVLIKDENETKFYIMEQLSLVQQEILLLMLQIFRRHYEKPELELDIL